MGTWGAGNFQDDSALDWLWTAVQKPVTAKIQAEVADHDECNGGEVMAAVEVLAVLCEHLRALPPKPEEVVQWQEAYLRAWERYIDGLDPAPGFKEERRQVIVSTFERLAAVAKGVHGGAT